MKTVLPRRTGEHDKAFTLRQLAYCMSRMDHCYRLQSDRRDEGNRGAAIFYQLEARTWFIRAQQFRAFLDGYIHGTAIRHDELFGPFASVFALIPERTHPAFKLATSSAYGKSDYGNRADEYAMQFIAGTSVEATEFVAMINESRIGRAKRVADAVIINFPVRRPNSDGD